MVSFNDWFNSVTGSPSEADKNKRDDQQRANDEKSKWDQDRGYVNNEWSNLLSEYGSGTFDGPAIKAQDPFETMSHQAIYDALSGVREGEINGKADGWRKLSSDARNAVDEFTRGVEQDITEHWNGKSGKSAIDATREFSASFSKLAATFQMVGHGLDLTQGHLAQAKGSVGKPDNYTTGDSFIDALPFQNIIKGPTHRAQEAESEARYVMTEYYRPGVADVDKITPILPEPTSTVDKNNPGVPNNNPGSNQPGSPNSNNPTGSPDSTDQKSTDDSKKRDSTGDPSTQPASTDPSDSTDKKSTNTTPASTTPANTSTTDDPTKSKTPSTPTTPSTPSNTPSTTFPGSPSRTPGTPSATPAPGKSIPGKPTTTPSAPAAAVARAASGKPGTAGAPGMGGAGAGRAKGDEDGEHKIPDYLIYDRGSELLGTQPPALPPGGVIGG